MEEFLKRKKKKSVLRRMKHFRMCWRGKIINHDVVRWRGVTVTTATLIFFFFFFPLTACPGVFCPSYTAAIWQRLHLVFKLKNDDGLFFFIHLEIHLTWTSMIQVSFCSRSEINVQTNPVLKTYSFPADTGDSFRKPETKKVRISFLLFLFSLPR